jgi:DNA-binding transcriptional MocR family regulator
VDAARLIRGHRAGEISDSVEAAVRSGALHPGDRLPPVRVLADQLGVSPTTVASAYRGLRLRGIVTAAGRRGTRVADRPPISAPIPIPDPPGARRLWQGNPDPQLLPDLGPVLARIGGSRRLYGEAANRVELLDAAAAAFAQDRIPPDFLAVVGGALDGIERTLGAHLRPGDGVIVEDPGYAAVFDLVAALGLRAVPVGVDDYGPLPAEVERALRGRVEAVIFTPRAQNPFGSAYDAGRVRALGRLLARHPEVLVVEDDHAGPVAGAAALSVAPGRARWAVVRSVSKSLGPDLRLAVMAGDPITISRVEGRQQIGAGWVSHILQRTVVELWSDPASNRLLDQAAAEYTRRRREVVAALAAAGFAAHARTGLNVWVPVADEAAALRRLGEAGWAVAPGQRYRLSSGPGIRISIGSLQPGEAAGIAAALAGVATSPVLTRTA